MKSRKDRVTFDPERQIDFVKLIETLDWTKEINPVSLVQTVNKVAGLSGRHKYETNEVSYGELLKSFESRVSKFVEIRIQGRDRFYKIKPEYSVDNITEYLGGKKKEEPTPKKTFPDSEAFMKTAVILKFFQIYGKTVETKEFRKIIEKASWKRQRSIEGKLYTLYQEAQRILTDYLYQPEGTLKVERTKIILTTEETPGKLLEDVSSLIEDPSELVTLMSLLSEISDGKERPKTVKATKSIERETKSIEVEKTTPTRTATPIRENPLRAWKKCLIADEICSLKRTDIVRYEDLRENLLYRRFLEIKIDELRDLIVEIETKYPGILEYGGEEFKLKNEILLAKFLNDYDSKNTTDEVYMRIRMTMEELEKAYPDLEFDIASPIEERDNIYRVTISRFIDSERAAAKLFWCLREGEVILEPKSNWEVRRIQIVMEGLGLNSIY